MRVNRVIVCALLCLGAGVLRAQAPAGQPIPNIMLQNQARETMRKLFAREYARTAPADRQALAKLLLAQGLATTDDAPARYAALSDAGDLAAGAGDAVTALAAADALAGTFSIDALDLRRTLLLKAHPAATAPADAENVMRLALETAEQAASVDAFDAVAQLASLAESAATRTRQVRVVASIQPRLLALRQLCTEFAQVKAAFTQLAARENDPAAHLAVGRFYALHKGQWGLGLPHLAAGSDAELASLAAQELARPTDGMAQAALADAWWACGEKLEAPAKLIVQAHAAEWYAQAQKNIPGTTLARIQSRLAAAQAQAPAAAQSHATTSLLPLIDAGRDAAQGTWARTADGIACESSGYATLQLPYTVPEEYDLRVVFTRTDGKGQIALLPVAGKKAFGFALDLKGESRFENVNGKAARDNPTITPVAISNGRKYTLTLEVRRDRVRALLDGAPLVEYKTDYKDLSRYSVWKLPDTTLPGLGANNARVTFHSVDIVEITGKGKPAR